MTQPALRLVSDTGEVVEPADAAEWRERYDRACELLADKDVTLERMGKDLRRMRDRVRELEGEFADKASKKNNAPQIRDVLLYWRERCATHKTRIVPDSPRWNKVRDRLTERDIDGDPAFTPQDLCEAVDGALLSDFHAGRDPKTDGKTYLAAETIFRDPGTVEKHLERLSRARGEAALDLAVLPDYVQENVALWLSEECGCGHVRAQHLHYRSGCCGTVRSEPRWSVCRCARFAPGGNL
jgi:hypothetical protein